MSYQAPTIPPRPVRTGASSSTTETPQIPPRPHRPSDQTELPNREAFTRSPLNDIPTKSNGSFYNTLNISQSDLPDRPPSVNLPSIGQEGNEYAGYESLSRTNSASPEQSRNVAPDLPLHQPTAAMPQSTAKAKIQTVTRTSSSQAAAVGIGKADHQDDKEHKEHPLRLRASFNRSNPAMSGSGTPRPVSVHEGEQEHGIPGIGLQIPLYPNAGDVQAPSPAPSAPPSAGLGSDIGQRNHHRRRSSRQEFIPPGSYGLHGHGLPAHGVTPLDPFEKAWYQKHPDELKKELGRHYDPGHPESEWALSSEDLNKLVHTGRGGIGFGTSPTMIGTPDEQIGYRASEEYASRMNSPKPTIAPLHTLKSRTSSSSHAHAESPLRKTSFAVNDGSHDGAMSDTEGDAINVQGPTQRAGKNTGATYDPPTEDLGPEGGNTEEGGGWIHERGHGVPILASDELAKRPGGEHLLPAVDPAQQKVGEDYHAGYDSDHPPQYQSGRRNKSRTGSRPGSSHGEPLARWISREPHDVSGVGTPLDEIQEYEPLFPEDEKDEKPKTATDSLKRPDLARHHFPSQDIWEDNPNSLQLTTTVSNPQMPDEREPTTHTATATPASSVFEHPDKEYQRKEFLKPSDRAHYLSKETEMYAKPSYKPGVLQDMPSSRPGLNQRFPSSDIWEDTPDSMRLETTVSGPQSPEIASPPEGKGIPEIPARPAAKQSEGAGLGLSKQTSPTERRVPTIPDRPKPSVPARPGAREAQSGVKSPPELKAKPAVPARPAGNKFASLKSNFMNDLNSRLQLGPQAPPKKEEPAEEAAEEEKAPLADARKGRAKGPARRKPAASPLSGEVSTPPAAFSFSPLRTVFSVSDDGVVNVPSATVGTSMTTSEATPQAPPREPSPMEEKATRAGMTPHAIGFEGDAPDPRISDGVIANHQAIQPELSAALARPEDTKPASAVASDPQTDDPAPAPAMVSSGAQTGQQHINIKSPTGEEEKLTTYLGGKAPDDGNVVVKEDGTEHLGAVNDNTPRRIDTTGHGM